jgi:hypothetical protein
MDYPKQKLSKYQIEEIKKFNNNIKVKFENTSCLNCQSNNDQILFKNDRYGFKLITVICKKCGLIYSNPRMTKDSTNYFYESNTYRDIYVGKSEDIRANADIKFNTIFSLEKKNKINMNKYYDQLFFDIINSLNLEYESVCEIGAGCGWNLKPLKQIGKKVYGYEPSKLLSNYAKKKNINIINGSSNNIRGEYDLVILRHVFEHFLNPIEDLKNLRKHIKKYIFVEVPGCINKLPELQNAHNLNFSMNTLGQILNKCGFKKIYFDYCRSNEFIFAVFEKVDKIDSFKYSYEDEVKRVLNIYKKFCINFKIRKMIKKINPNLEETIIKIAKKLKSFKNK